MPHLFRLRLFLSVVLIAAMSLICSASEIGNEFNDAWWVTKKMAAAPLHGSTSDYLIAGAVVSGVALTSIFDKDIRTEVLKQHGSWTKPIDKIGHEAQGPAVIFGTAGALYAYGWLRDNDPVRRTGIEIVEAYAISAVGTHIVKRVVGRYRPYESPDDNYRFGGMTIMKNAHMSFPSGDVTVVFAMASVVSAEAKWWPVTVASYGLGAMTAFQRIHKNQHWFSDTVGAAAWSTAVGLGVVHYNRVLSEKKTLPKLSAGPGSIGLVWSF